MRSFRFVLFIAALAATLFGSSAHADPLQKVAKNLCKGLQQLKAPVRIAVLPFPYHDGDISSGSSLVSERLTTLLVESGRAQVIERALLEKTMGEIKLG